MAEDQISGAVIICHLHFPNHWAWTPFLQPLSYLVFENWNCRGWFGLLSGPKSGSCGSLLVATVSSCCQIFPRKPVACNNIHYSLGVCNKNSGRVRETNCRLMNPVARNYLLIWYHLIRVLCQQPFSQVNGRLYSLLAKIFAYQKKLLTAWKPVQPLPDRPEWVLQLCWRMGVTGISPCTLRILWWP